MSTIETRLFDTENPPWPVRRFSVQEYRQLGECGVLTPEDRVELLEGWIVPKMNQRPAHGYTVAVLTEWLQKNCSEDSVVRCQLPITTENSEPEPDIAVVRGTHRKYRDGHPTGADCQLLIEVADTSVERDRQKAVIYAAASVAEYWIVNLVENQLEQYSQTSPGGYGSSVVRNRDESIEFALGEATLRLELSQLFE